MEIAHFQPEFAKEAQYKVDSFNLSLKDPLWHESLEVNDDLDFRNIMENDWFQFLNENLVTFAIRRLEPPIPGPKYYYGASNPLLSETMSKSKNSGVYYLEHGYMGYQELFNNSKSSDSKFRFPLLNSTFSLLL